MKKLAVIFTIISFFGSGAVLGSCDIHGTTTVSKPRFIINSGEVFDQKTKLSWYRCSLGSTWVSEGEAGCTGELQVMGLDDAMEQARNLGNGWRVPTVNELYSLVEQECMNLTVNNKVFPDIKEMGEGAPYWSVTRIEEIPSLYYYVDFINGDVDGHSKNFALAVRLVRDQQ